MGTGRQAGRVLFREAGGAAGVADMNSGMGVAGGDYDGDGDIDMVINTIGGQLVLLQNYGGTGNWLEVTLDGFHPGAVVSVVLPDGRELAWP